MARISINYTKYRKSKWATAVSFIGGLISSLLVYGLVLLLFWGIVSMFSDGFSMDFLIRLLIGSAILFGSAIGIKSIFQMLANRIGGIKK